MIKIFNEENEIENVETVEEVVKTPTEDTPAKKVTIESVPTEFMPENYNPFARPVNPRFANRPQRENPFESRLLDVKRVIKTTKGGRRFKFSALVVVGDGKGKIGYGVGKSIEVPEAIKKAERAARKNLFNVKVVGKQDTIAHDVIGHTGAAKVMLKPAAEGKGIIASDKVRAVVELAGIRNIYSKNMGTNNPLNVVRATVKGLTETRTKEDIMSLRDKKEL